MSVIVWYLPAFLPVALAASLAAVVSLLFAYSSPKNCKYCLWCARVCVCVCGIYTGGGCLCVCTCVCVFIQKCVCVFSCICLSARACTNLDQFFSAWCFLPARKPQEKYEQVCETDPTKNGQFTRGLWCSSQKRINHCNRPVSFASEMTSH